MLTLIVKELTSFKNAVRRDVIADGLSRPVRMGDEELLRRLVDYGNAYLEAHKEPDAIIWFDINFGDPAVVGMTWAHNPFMPEDSHNTGSDFFWRIWSEVDASSSMTLKQCQEEFSDYCVQRPS